MFSIDCDRYSIDIYTAVSLASTGAQRLLHSGWVCHAQLLLSSLGSAVLLLWVGRVTASKTRRKGKNVILFGSAEPRVWLPGLKHFNSEIWTFIRADSLAQTETSLRASRVQFTHLGVFAG